MKKTETSYYDSEEDDSFATRHKNDHHVVPGLQLGDAKNSLSGQITVKDYVSRTARGPIER